MNEVVKAVADIKYVREILERVQKQTGQFSFSHCLIELIIQAGMLSVAAAVLVTELVDNRLPSTILFASANDPLFRTFVIAATGVGLAGLALVLYSILLYGARLDQENYSDYISRNFRRFYRLNFTSDLFTKFICFSAVILSGVPSLVPPLLLLFTADTLFQGRLFLYRERCSVIAGILCLTAAALQVTVSSASLAVATGIFSTVACGSVILATLNLKRVVAGEKSLSLSGK